MTTPEQRALVKVEQLPVSHVRPDVAQARRDFDESRLAELTASIRMVGVLEPLEVRRDPDHADRYVIVYGERRWRAARAAGLATVPAIVTEGRWVRRRQLYENVVRVDLNVVELAANVAAVMAEENLDTKALAEQLTWPLRKVQRLVEIHGAPEVVKTAIVGGIDFTGERRTLAPSHALDVIRAYRHFAKTDRSPSKEKALLKTEKLVKRVVLEEWSALRLQDFVGALGRGRRVRDADLEIQLPKTVNVTAAATAASQPEPPAQSLARTTASAAADTAQNATLASGSPPRLFEKTDRRLVVHLERARACDDAVRRAELATALADLASEFAAR
jgi:ParB/RepB/Spo0J family partition protein